MEETPRGWHSRDEYAYHARMKNALTIICILLLGASLAGCTSEAEPPVDEDLMTLSWREFDQTMGGGWRAIADRGEYRLAALTIEAYQERNPETEPGKMAYMHFHCAQLWAFQEEWEKSIAHLDQAFVDEFPEGFPSTWNQLVGATRAFLQEDMDEYEKARAEINAMPNLSPRDSMFVIGVNGLSDYTRDTYIEYMLGE